MINAIGREIPDALLKELDREPYRGEFATPGRQERRSTPSRTVIPGEGKVLGDLSEAVRVSGLADGMTISFHHHLRNGDLVMRRVLEAVAAAGIGGLTVAASGLFPCHAFLEEYIRRGVVERIESNYISGELGRAVSRGLLPHPVIMRTHGGRDRALEAGDLRVDVAFLAASAADAYGNLNGVDGPSAFGSMGYARMDARYARCTVAVTDNLRPYPLPYVAVDQTLVDYVVPVERLGDPAKIVSGTTRLTRDPVGRLIARMAAAAVEAGGLFKDGLSFQTGAGGVPLSVAACLAERMKAAGIRGSFGMGGVTGALVDMLEDDLFDVLLDTQCFDLRAVASLRDNPRHREISCSTYSNPHTKGAAVNLLDVMILGATEIDTDFNVNVTTGSDGVIMGGSGGHSDAAAGSRLCVITANLNRARMPVVVERVETVNTPGASVDLLVTDRGMAVNPENGELRERLTAAGLPVVDIRDLKRTADELCGRPEPLRYRDRVVAAVEYRDGTLIDVIRQVD